METFLNVLFFAGGLVLIIFSANWLVDGASALARRFGISEMVIGLTIVGFGTSTPELSVNVFSAMSGATDIAIGNVVGSNVANILLILGISAIIFPIDVSKNTKWKEIPFSLMAALVLLIMALRFFVSGGSDCTPVLDFADGLILLSFFIIFMVYAFKVARNPDIAADVATSDKPVWRMMLLIVAGLAGLFFGGKFMVDGAVFIARMAGLSEKVIGLTIVAVGTSLPELATSVVAAIRKKGDIALGNVVGSNIFNVFFILGITALIRPLPVSASMITDLVVLAGTSMLLFISAVIIGTNRITRSEGVFFVVCYISYVVFLLTGGIEI